MVGWPFLLWYIAFNSVQHSSIEICFANSCKTVHCFARHGYNAAGISSRFSVRCVAAKIAAQSRINLWYGPLNNRPFRLQWLSCSAICHLMATETAQTTDAPRRLRVWKCTLRWRRGRTLQIGTIRWLWLKGYGCLRQKSDVCACAAFVRIAADRFFDQLQFLFVCATPSISERRLPLIQLYIALKYHQKYSYFHFIPRIGRSTFIMHVWKRAHSSKCPFSSVPVISLTFERCFHFVAVFIDCPRYVWLVVFLFAFQNWNNTNTRAKVIFLTTFSPHIA